MSIIYKEISRYQKYLIKMNKKAKFWYMVQLEIRITQDVSIVDAVTIPSEKELSIEEIEGNLMRYIKLNPRQKFFEEYRLHSFSIVEAYQLYAS
ncbi:MULTISPECIES: hypothetical protein [unclassified Paenibacillus]|uniref:hypothetical protein n=1 Tax=unclassified Paenibacillus TaxID=185978 RepID=UPI0030FCEF8F